MQQVRVKTKKKSKKQRILSYVNEIRTWIENYDDSGHRNKSILHWCDQIEKEMKPKERRCPSCQNLLQESK